MRRTVGLKAPADCAGSASHQNEAMTFHGKRYWAKRFAADAAQLEQRRQAGLKQAQAAADALKQT